MFDLDLVLPRRLRRRRSSRLSPMTSSTSSSSSSRRPRLDRRNAVKNIDYDAASTSWTSSSTVAPALSPSGLRATRSLDLSPADLSAADLKTSFRIGGGVEGEVDLLCRSLGLSGPEDFAIPAAAWAALKSRSSPSASHLPTVDETAKSDTITSQESTSDGDEAAGTSLCSPVGNRTIRDARSPVGSGGGHRGSDDDRGIGAAGLPDISRLEVRYSGEVARSVRSPPGEDRGIRGTRPPVLSPPSRVDVTGSNRRSPLSTRNRGPPEVAIGSNAPSPQVGARPSNVRSPVVGVERWLSPSTSAISPPPGLLPPPPTARRYMDRTSSAWDMVRSFAPEDDEVGVVASDAVQEEEGRNGEAAEDLTGSGLFSSDNEDDSSSTTDTAQVISPVNSTFRRIIGSWDKGELLGSGSFGTVYEGISDDGLFFAIKEVSLLDQGTNAKQCIFQLEQEIALLSQFEHENIVQYYGTDKEQDKKLFIFLELVTQGSLASLYRKYNLRDSQVSAYTRQILSGLKYLHDRNVVHRDIKCTNILVHANGSVKLADFGLAKEISNLNVLKSCKGSVYWMAPEVIQPKKTYGPSADIWSLGCTVLEMLTRQVPYPNLEWTQALFRIGRGEKPVIPDTLSDDARNFISQCVQVNPDDRPSASKLLEHPFVKRSLPASDFSDGSSHGNRR